MRRASHRFLTGGYWLRALLLVLATALLFSVNMSYRADFFGMRAMASLAHLATGLLVVSTLAYRERSALRICLGTITICWLFRMIHAEHAPIVPTMMGLLLALGVYWVMLWMRGFVYAGNADHAVFGARHIPRFLFAALLVLPGVYAVGNLMLLPPLQLPNWLAVASDTLQVFFAKFFGALILALPLLIMETEHRSHAAKPWWERPVPWQPVLLGVLVPALLLKLATQFHFDIDDVLEVLLQNRLLIAVLVVWASFKLPLRWSMSLLVLVEFSFATALSRHVDRSSELPDMLDLLRIALECMTLELMVLLLYLYSNERNTALAQYQQASLIEPLSGLPNLSALRQRHGHRTDIPLGFLILDRAEKVSASFGLQAQAAMSSWVAAQLDDIAEVFHIGTGQFVVLLRDAQTSWDSVLRRLQQQEFVWQERRFHVLPYLGVTEPALAHATLDTRITLASDAAIEARTRGESQVQLTRTASRADPREQHKRGLELSTTVLSRIRAMEVELYLQPFVPLSEAAASANINGELLCRLRDRDGRIIMPHLFVEQLQADRRMAELDLAMVRQLNRWLHEHQSLIPGIGRFCINLAGQSLASRGFARDLFAQLDTFVLPADRLCFEVTETAAIAYQAESVMLFEQLRERGCHIGIDDFGVGFQSFERLKQIPADVIKIDGSFVRDMTRSAYDLAVVRATVMIAQELNAQTVAEHVSDADTAQALRALNVDWAQGFFFATPLPIDEAIKRVNEAALI
jgi:EAL domain-containing protein (putative c-di-GMP-specific phosphodiesterase class I)/GGDEF domain-containing protein